LNKFRQIPEIVFDSPLWTQEKMTHGQALLDLYILASYKSGYIIRSKKLITLEPGQIGQTQEDLARRWQWSVNKVKRFIGDLEENRILKVERAGNFNLMTLRDHPQIEYKKDAKRTGERTGKRIAPIYKNKDIDINKDIDTQISEFDLSEFKEMYPTVNVKQKYKELKIYLNAKNPSIDNYKAYFETWLIRESKNSNGDSKKHPIKKVCPSGHMERECSDESTFAVCPECREQLIIPDLENEMKTTKGNKYGIFNE
jgi:hypothetical protein